MSNELSKISTRIAEKGDIVETEEATKTAFILPFIRLVLGYDHTDPAEVLPEFVADVGIKKGEKVDYAIMLDGKPIILMECKPARANLDHDRTISVKRSETKAASSIGGQGSAGQLPASGCYRSESGSRPD